MRKKEEILLEARKDVVDKTYKESSHLWLEVRKIEVLVDIRDSIEKMRVTIKEALTRLKAPK